MICFMFPSASQLALIDYLEAQAKLSAFEYENKESRESSNRSKRPSWSYFKYAPYRHESTTFNDTHPPVVYSGHFLPYFTGGLIHLTVQLLFSTGQLLFPTVQLL